MDAGKGRRSRPDDSGAALQAGIYGIKLLVIVADLLVIVDGVPLNKDSSHKAFDLRFLPRPEEIEAIEVFAGAASIPLKYGGAGDGKG